MSTSASNHQEQRNARLAELEATRRQIEAYQTLLQEVPTVFERKFRERLQPVLERNREIAAETEQLREQLRLALAPAATTATTELPAIAGRPSPSASRASACAGAAAIPDRASASEDSTSPGRTAAPAAGRQRRGSPRMRLRLPQPWPRRLLWSGTGLATAGLALLALGPLGRQLPLARLSHLLHFRSAEPGAIGPEELQLISQGSWIEVEDASGNPLYAGILEGERRFAIGPSLRLNAGRPDLVRYRIGKRPVATLGPIEAVGWRTLASPLQDPAATPTLDADLNPQL